MPGKRFIGSNTEYRLSLGLLILCAGLGIGSCNYLTNKSSQREETNPIVYPTQERDINGNGTPEKILYVNGIPSVSEVDGEPILEFLSKNKDK